MTKFLTNLQSIFTSHRLASGVVAVVIIFLLLVLASWHQFYRNTIEQYVPADASLYIRLSLPKLTASSGFNQMLESWLVDWGLAAVTINDIKREAAVVAVPTATGDMWALIVRTDRPHQLEKQLNDQDLVYHWLDGEHVVIGEEAIFARLAQQRSQRLSQEITSQFGRFDSLQLYVTAGWLNRQGDPTMQLAQSLAGQSTEEFVLTGQVTRQGLVLQRPQTKEIIPVVTDDQWEVMLVAREAKKLLTNLRPFLGVTDTATEPLVELAAAWRHQHGVKVSEELFDQIGTGPMVFLARPSGRKLNWPLADYDWHLALPLIDLSLTNLPAVEETILALVANRLPSNRTTVLSDGTRVVHDQPNPNNWAFATVDQRRVLSVPDLQTVISYQVENGWLKITNTSNTNFNITASQPQDIFRLRATLLPDTALWHYLRHFNTLTVTESSILLR